LDSKCRKRQCPATCRGGTIHPPRPGAPSCGTRYLRSVRARASANQVGYQTSVLGWIMSVGRYAIKVQDGSLAGLSSHRRPCTFCGHIALPIVQIGASPKGVACPAPPRPTPRSGTHWTWPADDFHRIAQGHHRDASCPAFANCTRSSAIAHRAKRTTIPLRRLHCASEANNPKHCKTSLQKVKIFKACRYLAIPLRFGYRGQGYEKRQP
jgi:hypothetical protein